MSNFLNKGKRKKQVLEDKEVRKRFNEIKKIKRELNKVSDLIIEKEDKITVDKLEEVAAKYTDIEIGHYEKLLILSKLYRKDKIVSDEN